MWWLEIKVAEEHRRQVLKGAEERVQEANARSGGRIVMHINSWEPGHVAAREREPLAELARWALDTPSTQIHFTYREHRTPADDLFLGAARQPTEG